MFALQSIATKTGGNWKHLMGEEVWFVPPPPGVKYRATMVRSRHASRGAERCKSEMRTR